LDDIWLSLPLIVALPVVLVKSQVASAFHPLSRIVS